MLAKCQKRNLKTYNWESLKNMSPSKIRQLRSCAHIMLGHIDKGQCVFSRLAIFVSEFTDSLQLYQSVLGTGDHLKSREHIAKVASEARCLCLWQ